MSRARDFADLAASADAGGITGSNLIINGAMQVWQRGTTIDTITNGAYLCDRWKVIHVGTDGNVDVDRSTDVPSGQGFGYSQKISMDASETSLDADDQVTIQQRFEGQDLQQLLKGTSSAKSLTLSFWVKSSVASTYTVLLKDHDNSRIIGRTYTISSANTWENKTITFAGDTTGALDNDNNRSLDLHFYLDAGSTYTGGTFATSWASDVYNTRVSDTTGWLESTSPEWYITGVQLEVGEQATPFEHRSYGDELARCQRYYFRINEGVNYQRFALGSCANSNNAQTTITLPVTMRTTPSVDTTGTAGDYAFFEAGIVHTLTSLPSINTSGSNAESVNVTCTSTGNFAAGNAGEFLSNNDTSVFFALSAER